MADYRVFPRSGSAEPEELMREKRRYSQGGRGGPPAYYSLPRRRRRSFCCRCCCCLCTSIATLLVLLFIAASIIYLVLNPKAPDFSVTRAYITEFNMTTQPIIKPAEAAGAKQPAAPFYLQTDVNFTVQVKNPNKKVGIYFEQVDVGLGYEEVGVGRGALPSFYVGVNESREMELQVKGRDAALTERVGMALQKKLMQATMAAGSSNSTNVWVQVETSARVRMRVWGQKTKAVKAIVRCDVQMSSPLPRSTAHIVSKSCRLKLLSLMQ